VVFSTHLVRKPSDPVGLSKQLWDKVLFRDCQLLLLGANGKKFLNMSEIPNNSVDMSIDFLEIAKRIQSIAQAGLTYSEGGYDIERYQELRDISIKMVSQMTGKSIGKVREVFASETGYQTPKVDIRSVVFRDGKILLVREKIDNCWSIPGGWADVGYSPYEVAVKETHEESGFEVEPIRLLAVMDKYKHPHPADIYHVYKIFILCRLLGGGEKTSIETSEIGFFDRDNLPELSLPRITESQIAMLFEFYDNPEKDVFCD
jgi:ADP-ribose pyrophosphatase YjhB (NUDIX family)